MTAGHGCMSSGKLLHLYESHMKICKMRSIISVTKFVVRIEIVCMLWIECLCLPLDSYVKIITLNMKIVGVRVFGSKCLN